MSQYILHTNNADIVFDTTRVTSISQLTDSKKDYPYVLSVCYGEKFDDACYETRKARNEAWKALDAHIREERSLKQETRK